MDHYHIWCDLGAGVSDMDFCERVTRYLGDLAAKGLIESHTITRRKLGLGPEALGEFHIVVDVRDLAQLDEAFQQVSSRQDPIESLHHGVNQYARNVTFALYRDFPDEHRVRGQERF